MRHDLELSAKKALFKIVNSENQEFQEHSTKDKV